MAEVNDSLTREEVMGVMNIAGPSAMPVARAVRSDAGHTDSPRMSGGRQ
jgi:hypothetical protein